MQSQVVLITLLAHMLGAMAFIAMCFGSIRRTSLSLAQKNLLQGLLFGGATIISMISPMEIEPGVLIATEK